MTTFADVLDNVSNDPNINSYFVRAMLRIAYHIVKALQLVKEGVSTGATNFAAGTGTAGATVTLLAAQRTNRRRITIGNSGSHPIRISPNAQGTEYYRLINNAAPLAIETTAAIYVVRDDGQDGQYTYFETYNVEA